MLVISKIIKCMEKVKWFMIMVKWLQDNGKMIIILILIKLTTIQDSIKKQLKEHQKIVACSKKMLMLMFPVI